MAYIKKDRRDDEQRSRGERDERREGGARGERSPSTPLRDRQDKKPYGERRDSKPSGDRRDSRGRGDSKPYGERGERSPSTPLRDRQDKKPYGDRTERKPYGDRTDRKPYGERGERRDSKPSGDRKPYGERGERREGGERKPYGDRPKPNERGSSYTNRPVRSSDENRDRSSSAPLRDRNDRSDRKPYAERSENRDTDRNAYKPRSKKTFEEKPSRGRPERRTKSDKITPHKPGAFDVFDKRFAKPNIKEEIKKERKESRERKVENYERAREERGGRRDAEAQRGSRERRVSTERAEPRERVARAPRVREEKVESTEKFEGYDRKKTAPDEEIRLNKFIANSGVCSRRKADELIEKGEITVNGEVVRELGYKVKHTDKIKYDGKLLKPGKLVYVLLNKPKDYITTMDDPEERRTVIQLTAKATNERIFPVGRLDRNTTGLLLLTNDGDLADKLAHPRNQVKKVYEVELDKSLSTSDFEKIKEGVELEDGPAKPDQISYLDGKSKKFLGIEIHIGRNRIVRRIFESLGYEVVRLDRVIYAGLSKKDLPRGRHRMLTKEEIIYLKHLNKY